MRSANALLLGLVRSVIRPLYNKGVGRLPPIRFLYDFVWSALGRGTVTVRVQSSLLRLDLRDRLVSRILYLTGVYEQGETRLFKSLVKPGMVVVDIGAHIGYYTLLAARLVGPEGKVFALEPERHNFDLLLQNIALNGYSNVVALNMAVSDRNSRVYLLLNKEGNQGGHRISGAVTGNEGIMVDAITLDELMRRYEVNPNVIKMDIEGHEFHALQGMRETITQTPGLSLITEFWPYGLRTAGSDPGAFLEALGDSGYAIQLIDETRGSTEAVGEVG